MSLNDLPSGERIHIGFFGVRNAGKSSLVNAVTGQQLSVVSDVKGTTTDPVRKAMELLPIGPVVIIDTPGSDDEGALGALRVERMKDALSQCDAAVLVIDAVRGRTPADDEMLTLIKARGIPYIVAWNKSDRPDASAPEDGAVPVSAITGASVERFKERLAAIMPQQDEKKIAGDLVKPGDLCVLVCPIDESAPKGRLILPQQMTIRDLLEVGAAAVVTKETELRQTLDMLGKKPALVITDSQAFRVVNETVPQDIPLTSFSILLARYKGFLRQSVEGISAVKTLNDGDTVLMAEGCTHHRQCKDIGTVKIPAWLRRFTGKDIQIQTCSGREFPEDLSPYKLVIHCGGCMLTETVVQERMHQALRQGVPFTNYGIAIAHITGALERSMRIFPELHALLEDRN